MMNNIIEIKNVSFDYKSEDTVSRGVKNVNLAIEKGSFVAVLGHNGSGKSTLARLLNGFLMPNEGEILVDSINTNEEDRIFDIRSRVGMVFQNPDNQMVASIIEDDLAFGPENLGVAPAEIRKRVDWALEAVNMFHNKDRDPNRLSGGQKQRVAIAAVLAMMPDVLILDEATAMLDPKGRSEVIATIEALNKEHGMTIILITHYMDEAINADKVIVMNKGEMVKSGTPREVFSDTQTVVDSGLELPVATQVSLLLQQKNIPIKTVLSDHELMEALCQLK
ncbi:MAG: energy-coupling factor transporter ATPase [Bacillota bacterium]